VERLPRLWSPVGAAGRVCPAFLFPGFPAIVVLAKHLTVGRAGLAPLVPGLDVIGFHLLNLEIFFRIWGICPSAARILGVSPCRRTSEDSGIAHPSSADTENSRFFLPASSFSISMATSLAGLSLSVPEQN